MPKVSQFRWVIVALLALAAVLNYVDRQTLAVMAETVQSDLAIDDRGYAILVNCFLFAYMAGGLISALIIDKVGTRWGMVIFVGFWSLASAASGLAQNMFQLGASRAALGLAEAGSWIASPRLVREWMPARERAFAIGLYSSAAHFGATLAPALIGFLLLAVGWRNTFLLTGLVGVAWVAAWLMLYRPAHTLPIYEEGSSAPPQGAPDKENLLQGWKAVVRTRAVWAIAVGNALTAPVWFFYLFWFPKYLTEERGISVAQLASTSWVVYGAAGFGAILGGVASGALVRRGMRPAKARLVVMASIALIAPIGALNALQPSVSISLALGALVAFCHTAWVTNQTALPVDLYPTRHVSKVMSLGGIFSGLVGMGSTYLVGELVGSLTYRPMFLVIAVAYPLGLVAASLALTAKSMAETEGSA